MLSFELGQGRANSAGSVDDPASGRRFHDTIEFHGSCNFADYSLASDCCPNNRGSNDDRRHDEDRTDYYDGAAQGRLPRSDRPL